MTYPYGQPGGPPQGGPSFGAPPGQQAPGYPQPYGPARVYADWGRRAGAYLIDFAPLLGGIVLALLVSMASGVAGTIVYLLAILGNLAWTVFNRWINGGNTGQSLGKRIVGIKLVSEATGEPIGAGMAFVRDLAHALDSMAFALGYLWPLWDDKAQTFSDKILSTIVVPADPSPSGAPGAAFGQQSGFPGQPGGFGQPGQPGGFPGQPGAPAGFGQPGDFPGQPGAAPGFGQPASAGFPAQPNAGFPAAPGGFGAPQSGYGQPPVPGTPPQQGFGQPGVPPQPAFGQPVQPQPAFGQPGQPQPGFGQPPAAPGAGASPQQPGPTAFEQPEPTQVVRPAAPRQSPSEAFGAAERTQVVKPAGEPEATQMIKPETPEPGPAQS
ncbi:RDD family protein [Amycolatopsis sp. NPDC059090]|uniref:RDD family protein n=1 Tax=unclassified Amycolatopsis TaxID=2618356 RepID=UPI003671CEF3